MKHFKFSFFIFVLGILFCIPYNTNALENKIVRCSYQFTNQNGKEITLNYDVYDNGKVDLPFTDGTLYSKDGRAWYHSDSFSSIFYNASKVNSSTVTCPTIFVQENDLGVTVYPNSNSSCSGRCYNIASSSPKLSSWAKENKIESKRVLSTCMGSSVGFYNRKSYVYPYFRIFSDGTKEWSVDGKTFVPVTNAITGNVNGEKFSFTVNDSLLNSIYSSSKATCPTQIYRCVVKNKNGYSYELSTSQSSCSKDELSTIDGQQNGSNYASGAFGDPNGDNSNNSDVSLDELRDDLNSFGNESDCESLLGDPEDKESVAWLVQQILNYIKILGPILIVILSSVDFAKAIFSSDDDTMKKAEKKLMIRLVLAVMLFLIPTLVSVLLNTFGISTDGICNLK